MVVNYEGSFTVRMQGTDAPERDQPFSKESKDFLNRYLHIEATTISHGYDRYGRLLGTLIIDCQDINLLSIKEGYSWHFKKFSKDPDYSVAEKLSRNNNLGLWNLENPIPPWDWRR